MARSLTALKREIVVGTRIQCLTHWADAVRTDLPPLGGDVRTVTKTQTNGYACTTTARPGAHWSYWPKAALVTFDEDAGTFTVAYKRGSATFRVLSPPACP